MQILAEILVPFESHHFSFTTISVKKEALSFNSYIFNSGNYS